MFWKTRRTCCSAISSAVAVPQFKRDGEPFVRHLLTSLTNSLKRVSFPPRRYAVASHSSAIEQADALPLRGPATRGTPTLPQRCEAPFGDASIEAVHRSWARSSPHVRSFVGSRGLVRAGASKGMKGGRSASEISCFHLLGSCRGGSGFFSTIPDFSSASFNDPAIPSFYAGWFGMSRRPRYTTTPTRTACRASRGRRRW